jgi:Gas vesicle protein G
MGLFKEIALLPLAPVRGTAWVTEQIAEEADRQLYDEDNIKREMLQLEIDEEEGRIGPKERAAMEDDLLERLAVARERRLAEQEALAAEAREMEELGSQVVEAEGREVTEPGRQAHDSEERSTNG